MEHSIDWGLGQSSAREIDAIGIRLATEKAMIRAIHKLRKAPSLILVDGNLPLRLWDGKQSSVIRGESHYPSIAAASILAKVSRDIYIKELCDKYPKLDEYYGLKSNKGYGAKKHMKGIETHGITPWHRRTFGVCKNY